MTKPDQGEHPRRCGWCGRPLPAPAATGRPRRYCRASCRQRDFEARQRSAEVGLSEAELVVARAELAELQDLLYVLEAAVEDVDRDLAAAAAVTADGEPPHEEVAAALNWLLSAARPVVNHRLGGRP